MLKPLQIDMSRIVPQPGDDALMIGYEVGSIAGRLIAMREMHERGMQPRPYSAYVRPASFETLRDAIREAGYHVETSGDCVLSISIAQPVTASGALVQASGQGS